jgi:flagellar basal body-associated protein FliL
MAFCNSCGGAMEAGAKFCPKCGAAAPAAAVSSSAPVPAGVPAPPAKSSSALKIILIVLAVIVVLGVLGVGTAAFFIHRAISRSHVTNRDGEVRVETPFGNLESTEDPQEAARNLGVDIYPGATVVKNSAANMSFGGMHTAAAEFESDDSTSKVADFYKSKFPNANVMSSNDDRYTIISGQKGDITTITIEPKEGKTHIHIAKVVGKVTSSTSN